MRLRKVFIIVYGVYNNHIQFSIFFIANVHGYVSLTPTPIGFIIHSFTYILHYESFIFSVFECVYDFPTVL